MDNRFLLDRDYKTFTSSQQLKFRTVTEMNAFGMVVMILLALFYVPLSSFMLFAFLQQMVLERAYATEGREINATVITCETRHGKNGQYPAITYFYRIGDTVYQGDQTFDSSTSCDFFHPDTSLRALYLPSNPQESRILDHDPSLGTRLIYALLVGAGLFAVCAAVVPVYQIIKYPLDKRRFRRLWRNGVLLDGEVIDAKGKVGGKPSQYILYVTYRFQTLDGRTLTRKQSRPREDLRRAELPISGTPVSVLYTDDDAVVML